MSMPTQAQIEDAIKHHKNSVGAACVTVTEVALALDARTPDMTASEFAELRQILQPMVAQVRMDGLAAIWG